MPQTTNQCLSCAYNLNLGPEGGICRAFPLGKPQEILNGLFSHTKPHKEQYNKAILFSETLPPEAETFPEREDFEDGILKVPGEDRPQFPPYQNGDTVAD